MDWAQTTLRSLKEQGARLFTYVPDNVLIPLIAGARADDDLTIFTASREDEAVGIACGAALGGMSAVAMMQSSGFGNVPNVLASLAVPYQIPVLMIISERGALGEYNYVQVPIARMIRPALDALGITHVTLSRPDEVEFLVSRTAGQAFKTQQPAALILSPMLTGGKQDR